MHQIEEILAQTGNDLSSYCLKLAGTIGFCPGSFKTNNFKINFLNPNPGNFFGKFSGRFSHGYRKKKYFTYFVILKS